MFLKVCSTLRETYCTHPCQQCTIPVMSQLYTCTVEVYTVHSNADLKLYH